MAYGHTPCQKECLRHGGMDEGLPNKLMALRNNEFGTVFVAVVGLEGYWLGHEFWHGVVWGGGHGGGTAGGAVAAADAG